MQLCTGDHSLTFSYQNLGNFSLMGFYSRSGKSHKSFAPRSRQTATPILHHSVFAGRICPSCRSTKSVKALKAKALKAKSTPSGKIFQILLLRFNRGHRLTFFARIWCLFVPLQRKTSSLYPLQKHQSFPLPFCVPLALGAEILTREIWVWPTYACKILSGSIKVCWSYLQKADFEQIHIMLSCKCMTAHN